MLILDLILQIINQIDQYQNKKNKNVFELMKDKLGGKIMAKFVRFRAKAYSYLIDDNSEG